MTEINEWEFTADVASQINEILQQRPDLPFSQAQCEQRGKGSTKRRDLTIYNRANKIVLTGEVKLPDKRDGRSPLNEAVVVDAHNKANSIGVEYFFTWNVNNCVLWKTFEQGKPITDRSVEFFDALPAPVSKSDELTQPRVKDQIKKFLVQLLERSAAIFSGEKPLEKLPLDTKFIKVWELALLPLVRETLFAISAKYSADKAFRVQLDRWMREEQGWTLSKDEEEIRRNLTRAAQFSCYVLANKIVFYKALRRQFAGLKDLEIIKSVKSGATLQQVLADTFKHATEITLDYETVFQTDFGDSLPLQSDDSVESWRDLIDDANKFDFTRLNYEVIGQIFENLLSPEERHKFGQHYTRSEVVDLINAFCIRDATAKVLDPSCGGGTFLVRAYQRKSDLANGALSHQELISQIFGTDISAYPVHLTTINLATRDLKEGANYPRVARGDFLKTNLNQKIFHVPNNGGDSFQPLPKVDAVVGNPPYVRQEKINEYYGAAYKKFLQQTIKTDAPEADLSGRSDVLCYFFTHSFALLEEGGYIGLLTSSNWLDTAYGFRLQKFLLDNFEIIAIFESNCEPWFTGARVTTAATILRKQPDAKLREANNVKFVWLKKPIADFVSYNKTDESSRRATFEDIRERIENLTEEEENDVWRVRVVNQAELYQAGCLSFAVSAEDEEDAEDDGSAARSVPPALADGSSVVLPEQSSFLNQPQQQSLRIDSNNPQSEINAPQSEYTGYKWGIYLRAPEIFSKLLQRAKSRLVPLGQIAEVRFGVKSGCDAFFFPRDVTDEKLAENLSERDFKERYGISKNETDKIRIVHAGDGSVHLIEAEYLEPEVHTVMELDSVEIVPENLKRKILLLDLPKEKLKGTQVLKYINYGEREKIPERSTIESRASASRMWYDIKTDRRSDVLWCKAHQYRHIAWLNSHHLVANCRLYDIFTQPDYKAEILCAILNSTFIALAKAFFGRYVGREGNLDTEVLDVKMMLVPDPREVSIQIQEKLVNAFELMRQRKSVTLVDVDSTETDKFTGELALRDRQQLDDAVLELLGIEDGSEREALQTELYREITNLYRQIRVAEKKMQKFRSESARKGKQTAQSIAEEIWVEFDPKPNFVTPLDFVPPRAPSEKITIPAGRAKIVAQTLLQPDGVQIGSEFISLGNESRSNFVKRLSQLELTGEIAIPVAPQICQAALSDYEKAVEDLTEKFRAEAATFTADENLQEKTVRELWKKTRT